MRVIVILFLCFCCVGSNSISFIPSDCRISEELFLCKFLSCDGQKVLACEASLGVCSVNFQFIVKDSHLRRLKFHDFISLGYSVKISGLLHPDFLRDMEKSNLRKAYAACGIITPDLLNIAYNSLGKYIVLQSMKSYCRNILFKHGNELPSLAYVAVVDESTLKDDNSLNYTSYDLSNATSLNPVSKRVKRSIQNGLGRSLCCGPLIPWGDVLPNGQEMPNKSKRKKGSVLFQKIFGWWLSDDDETTTTTTPKPRKHTHDELKK